MTAPNLLSSAGEELRSAVRWYESRREGLGAEFLSAVQAALRRVAANPDTLAAWPENPKFRRALVSRFPYTLYYRVINGTPVVFAVALARRQPDYWLNRANQKDEGP
ncbi:type II toxin-antitoxin system RelE/ParE family toxin [Myxococcota bacterium]|nr:type II toxin-antitoxin system RelE/ParE family toxin [Myxococcota bacterium]